jgi:catechol 2,3-dioxygenase-like lactoylglutathione lyase family enzyme
MIDHTGIQVADLDRSLAFFEKALAPLGYTVIRRVQNIAAGLGVGGKPDFWLAGVGAPTDKVHIAFRAKGRAEVRAFYEAALAAGGTDNGAPGVREIYHPTYSGAYVLDPDGNNIEAVCHAPA